MLGISWIPFNVLPEVQINDGISFTLIFNDQTVLLKLNMILRDSHGCNAVTMNDEEPFLALELTTSHATGPEIGTAVIMTL